MMRSCGSICTSVVAWPYEPKVPTLPRVSFAPRSVLARTPRPNLFFRSYRGAFEKAFIGADARLFASLCEGRDAVCAASVPTVSAWRKWIAGTKVCPLQAQRPVSSVREGKKL